MGEGAQGGGCGVGAKKKREHRNIQTPEIMRTLVGESSDEGEFVGFRREKASKDRIRDLENQVKILQKLMGEMYSNQDKIIEEYREVRGKCEFMEREIREGRDIRKKIEGILEENKDLRKRCNSYEKEIQQMKERIEERKVVEGGEVKVEELKNAWKLERGKRKNHL